MTTISIKNLTFQYDNQLQPLFEHVNLNLSSTWKLGLLGRNGRGKTTFFKLLMQQLKPTTGQITDKLPLSYFPLKIADPSMLTLYALQDQLTAEQWQLEKELSQLNTDPADLLWRPFKQLSGGEQTKVLLAALFADKQVFPLIDEPTNHLDRETRKLVAQYLKSKKQGFILTSHDRQFLDEVIDHVLAIEKRQITLMHGNYSTYLAQKEQQDQFETAQNAKLQKEISALKTAAAQKAQWSQKSEAQKSHGAHQHVSNEERNIDKGFLGHHAAKIMKKAQQINKRMEAQISEKQSLMQNIDHIVPLSMQSVDINSSELIKAENFSLSYTDEPLFKPLSFTLYPHERLALVGPNGIGKSSLLKTIFDESADVHVTGKLIKDSHLKISYLSQIDLDFTGSLSAFANQNHLEYSALLNMLRKLGMPRNTFDTPINQMSKGQQKRVALAKSLIEEANLYIWDEPLNYLDIYNQQQLIDIINQVQPTMLLVEHDQHFLKAISAQACKLNKNY